MDKPLRIVFMGTPDFAAYILNSLCDWSGCEVVGVYCQPDRPAGRGKKLMPPAVKVMANEHNIAVYQPLNFKNAQDVEFLASLKPDILAVAAYGLILPQSVLDIPSIAPINVHASLLPLYRGAAPIQRAIMDCHAETGVSIMRMEAGLDTGPVYAMKSTQILEHTAASLHDELAKIGAEVLIEVLSKMQVQTLTPTAQDDAKASHAAKLTKQDGVIDWTKPAHVVHAQIRGVSPWPGAQLTLLRPDNEKIVLRLNKGYIGSEKASYSQILGVDANALRAGQVWLVDNENIAICTADKFYILQSVRPMNKNEMPAADFARGYLLKGQTDSNSNSPLAIVDV